jgi:hypothetical protein
VNEPPAPSLEPPEPEATKATRYPDDPGDSDDDDDDDDGYGDEGGNPKGKPNTEMAKAQAVYAASRPGRIPDGLGIVFINNRYEHDNDLWQMTGRYFYHSIRSNCIFAGKTATVASDYEGRMSDSYMTPGS